MIRELKWTRASDVFSFGVVAFEVLSGGQLPYASLSDDVLMANLSDPLKPAVQLLFGPLLPTLPPPLCVIVCGRIMHSCSPLYPVRGCWCT